MATIPELIELLAGEHDEDFNPTTVYDDLNAEYTNVSDSHTAELAERDAQIANLTQTIVELKAAGFDKLMSEPAEDVQSKPEGAEAVDNVDDEDLTYDDLFDEKEED